MTVAASLAGLTPPRRRMALAWKFALALIGLVTLVLVINGLINVWLSYEEAKRASVRVQREKAQAAAERIDLFVSGIEQQLGWTTRAEWARTPVEQRRYDFIRLLRQAPAITELIHLDGAGKEQLRLSRLEPDVVGSGADYSADPRFTKAIETKIWFGPVTFRRGSEPYTTIALAHGGRLPGVTIAEVNLKLIWDVVTSIKIGEAGYAFITDASGRLIAHPDMSLVLRETNLSKLTHVAQTIAGSSAAAGPIDVTTSTGVDGKTLLAASAPIARLKWFVFVQVPAAEALAPVYASLAQTAALLGLGLVLASVMGGLLAQRMVVPIQKLQAGAERLGSGALDQRIDIKTGDEIETLAGSFNLMAERIQDSYATLEAKVEARTHDLNEALVYQTGSSNILKVIASSPTDVAPVLQAIVDSACEVCDAQDAAVMLKDGDVLRFSAHRGPIPIGIASWPINRNWTAGRAFLDKAPVHVHDLHGPEGEAFPDGRELSMRMGHRSILSVPLLREGESIGAIALRRTVAQPFSDKQIDLLQTFANQAVIAIGNVRLFDEVQARTKEVTEALEYQTATSEVLGVISKSPSQVEPVFNAIVTTARRLCGAEYALISQRSQDELFRLAAHSGATPEFVEWLQTKPVRAGDGSAVGIVARDKCKLHLPDALADPRFTDLKRQRQSKARTMLAVPLMSAGEVTGVVFLAHTVVKPFTERQIELVTTFADQAVIAIENARLFEQVQERTKELSQSLDELRATQDRLVQTEKLASLGQLTAGIAHEIKNPLNFVNNFAALSGELLSELDDALKPAPLNDNTRAEINELTAMLKGNLEKVVQHGKRADSIVKNMLLHSREGSGEHRAVDVNALVEESVNLAYHGARAEKPGFNITLEKQLDLSAGQVDLFPQEITRVLLNLVTNGFYAATKRKQENADAGFEPTLTAATRNLGDRVEIRIRDNGSGIPPEVKARMFNPFFTTKPAGEGTGLGLSLSHDIVVKQHAGTIEVDTVPGAFTEFTVTLPRLLAKQTVSGKSQ